ncbi:chaplin [Streptomyces sp. NPDC059680]|uniref:chaplin n=1 Tax=Streptomyces sp. NPDC059680 TaxID=3346904 RepID=UPI0036CC189F
MKRPIKIWETSNVRKMTRAAVLGAAAASLVLTGAVSAAADPAADNHGVDIPILSNNLIHLPVDIPINVCGNTISILGFAPLAPSGTTSCENSRLMTPEPVSMPPATVPPVTPPPVTAPPVTAPPVTVPPVTVPPVTIPPITVPPVTTPPVTIPPITVRPGAGTEAPEIPL